jgi:hypothetical protein
MITPINPVVLLPPVVTGRQTGSAVGSGALRAALPIASEFMPVRLLTAVATDWHATEGTAGQAVQDRKGRGATGCVRLSLHASKGLEAIPCIRTTNRR